MLAVEIFAPTPADLQTTWVDWNPSPPDKNMGLWQPAYLERERRRGDPLSAVVSRVDTATLKSADLTVVTDLKNLTAKAVTGTLRGRIGTSASARPSRSRRTTARW